MDMDLDLDFLNSGPKLRSFIFVDIPHPLSQSLLLSNYDVITRSCDVVSAFAKSPEIFFIFNLKLIWGKIILKTIYFYFIFIFIFFYFYFCFYFYFYFNKCIPHTFSSHTFSSHTFFSYAFSIHAFSYRLSLSGLCSLFRGGGCNSSVFIFRGPSCTSPLQQDLHEGVRLLEGSDSLCDPIWLLATALCILELEKFASVQTSVH